jgi:pimeloyl-ACP methyl ester carboxylesterase
MPPETGATLTPSAPRPSVSTSSPITTQFREIDGLKIRYAESRAPRDAQALLLSPWPESLYSFEPMWEQLAEHAHLVAIDLPGFGHSEARGDLFSSRSMAEFVLKALDAFELENPHTVGPDIGTSTLLFAAASQPGCLRSIVIGAEPRPSPSSSEAHSRTSSTHLTSSKCAR